MIDPHNVIIPLEVLRDELGIPDRTLRRRLADVPKVEYNRGKEHRKGVRWSDLVAYGIIDH